MTIHGHNSPPPPLPPTAAIKAVAAVSFSEKRAKYLPINCWMKELPIELSVSVCGSTPPCDVVNVEWIWAGELNPSFVANWWLLAVVLLVVTWRLIEECLVYQRKFRRWLLCQPYRFCKGKALFNRPEFEKNGESRPSSAVKHLLPASVLQSKASYYLLLLITNGCLQRAPTICNICCCWNKSETKEGKRNKKSVVRFVVGQENSVSKWM